MSHQQAKYPVELIQTHTPAQITDTITQLRRARADALVPLSQQTVMEAIAEWAARWQDPHNAFRREAAAWTEPFAFSHVQVSLDGLLPSLSVPALTELIDTEGVADAWGAPVAGHVLAGNTPLLSWTSLLRALLMRSASLAKLPSGPAARWAEIFVRSLAVVSPALASCITLMQWPGGTADLDTALCENVDLVMCHGSDSAIAALRARTPPQTPFVGYGHALSLGLVLGTDNWGTSAAGFARDILVYAQGGCLSVQTILVRSTDADAARFAERLAASLEAAARDYPPPHSPTPQEQQQRHTARTLALLQPGAAYWEAGAGGAVLLWPRGPVRVLEGMGIVCVQAVPPRARLSAVLAPLSGSLQGCAVAGAVPAALRAQLEEAGVSRVCAPGLLQAPPLSWRQNGRDVLGVLRGVCGLSLGIARASIGLS